MSLNNVPLNGQSLATTKPLINQNFSTINAAFLVDHVEYATAGQGKHNKVTMPVQASAPVFSAGENGIYSLAYNNTATTKNEIFAHHQTFAGTLDTPFTASILSSANPTSGQSGWGILASGIKLVWGVGSGSTGGPVTITLVGPQAFATRILSVQCTIFNPSGSFDQAFVRVQSFGTNSFNAVVSGASASSFNNSQFTYLAIGY